MMHICVYVCIRVLVFTRPLTKRQFYPRVPNSTFAATPATPEEQEKENQDAVVEFRYVYDDASWSRGSTGAAAGTRRQQQQQQQLLRTEQQLIQLQQQQERRCGGDAAAGGSQELGAITSTGLQISGSGSGGGGDRASWMKQQMSRVHDATERTAVEQLGRGQGQKLGRTAKGARTHDSKWTSDCGMGNSRRVRPCGVGCSATRGFPVREGRWLWGHT